MVARDMVQLFQSNRLLTNLLENAIASLIKNRRVSLIPFLLKIY